MEKPGELFNLIDLVAAEASASDIEIYIVGGFVRDGLLVRETSDVDFAVKDRSEYMAHTIAERIGGTPVLLDDLHKVIRVVKETNGERYQLDFSNYDSSIEDDLLRRDFTIDAMAIKPQDMLENKFNVVDPHGGQAHISTKQITAVTSSVFSDDPVRMLRAIRLAGELGFKIDSATESLTRKHRDSIRQVAGERVRIELIGILAVSNSGYWLKYLDSLDLLGKLIPEILDMKGVVQPKEHYWDVFNHSINTVIAVECLLGYGNWEFGGNNLLVSLVHKDEMIVHLQNNITADCRRLQLLKLGALLHDIAKPAMKTVEENGRIRFIGHAKKGAQMATEIMQHLRFSNKEIKIVEKLVTHHLRPVQMANSGLPTSRAIYRFFRDTEEDSYDILLLALGDYLAAKGLNLDMRDWAEHCKLIDHIIRIHDEQKYINLPSKVIDGNDIMRVFGLTSGPLIGKLLDLVYEAYAIGTVNNSDEAIALVREELKSCSTNLTGNKIEKK